MARIEHVPPFFISNADDCLWRKAVLEERIVRQYLLQHLVFPISPDPIVGILLTGRMSGIAVGEVAQRWDSVEVVMP
jgi:hypothetical protein